MDNLSKVLVMLVRGRHINTLLGDLNLLAWPGKLQAGKGVVPTQSRVGSM